MSPLPKTGGMRDRTDSELEPLFKESPNIKVPCTPDLGAETLPEELEPESRESPNIDTPDLWDRALVSKETLLEFETAEDLE